MRPLRLAALFLFLPALARAQEADLRTVAEKTDFTATSTSEEVRDLASRIDRASEFASMAELGRSTEGKSLPILILSDPPVADAAAARKSGKPVVLLFANIHAGEVDAKEAVLMLARELTQPKPDPLLKELVVAIVPNYNPDGNDKMATTNRPGQVGPEKGMGRRENGQGLDLNRDFVKLEAPETRALVAWIREWNPSIVVDGHTTNGSHHRYTITHAGPKSPAGDRRLINYVDDRLLHDVGVSMEKENGWKSFAYGNFNRDHDRWFTFAPEPRYSTNYFGLIGKIGILSESYSYASYKDRILATRDFCRQILKFAASHKDEIAKLLADASSTGQVGEPVAIRSEAKARSKPALALGYVEAESNGRRVATSETRDYEVALWDDFGAKETVPRPAFYLVPGRFSKAIETLKLHGLDVGTLREEVEGNVAVDRVDDLRRSQNPYQGKSADLTTTRREESRKIPAGTAVVPATGPLGSLAVMLLEPRSEDSLTTWGFFDEGLEAGRDFPVVRLMKASASPLPLQPSKAPTETAGPSALQRPGVQRGGSGFLRWLDNTHYAQTKEGKAYKVDALTGEAEPIEGEAPAPAPGVLAVPRRPAGAPAPDGGELAEASPDGKRLAFIKQNDLYVQDAATKEVKALTKGGSDRVRHGKADWVYFEEIFNRNWKAYWWSPDSKHIAFLDIDDRNIPTHHVLIDTNEPRKVEETAYPRSGEPNPRVRFGIVAVETGKVAYADLSAYNPDDFLISDVAWWPDSSVAYFYGQNRTQTWLDFLTMAPDGATKKLFRETTGAWVESLGAIKVLKDGTFLVKSERDGYKHFYRYNPDGTLKNRVTSGNWELRGGRGGSEVVRLDEEGGWIYVTGMKETGLGTALYRAKLDGSATELITKGPGSHSDTFSPDGSLIFDEASGREVAPNAQVLKADGSVVRKVETGPEPAAADPKAPKREIVTIPTRDGFPLEAEVILPPNLDESGKTLYPVWLMTYGGPHTPTLNDAWRGNAAPAGLEGDLLKEGFIVFKVDPRSASGKGAKSAWAAFRKLGVQENEDIKDAVGWLKKRPYVDGSRVGMSGHSYGGYLTAYCLTHSDVFAAGIAGAPVTDWRDYDSIYTERFMGTPQDNPDGYKASSVVEAARDLHGKLLILHGAIDDNVSMRNTMRLVHALQQADKDFELMIYPSARHGIGGAHYQRIQRDFIKRTLGGPKSRD
ncbi:MAG: DPP IV N-terminal domain-containing protein [Isosphaeraceae bacterium]